MRMIRLLFILFGVMVLASCNGSDTSTSVSDSEGVDGEVIDVMEVVVGDVVYTAELYQNSSVDSLIEMLKEGPLTISMEDYGNFEKVGDIGRTLPRNDEYFTTGPGDIILYLGSRLVLYYDTNSYSFTHIGKIKNVSTSELLDVLGEGDVEVTFRLGE